MSDLPNTHPHHPFLQHHFEDLGQQHEASTLGMWMFLGVKGYEYHEHYKEGLFPSATTFTWTSAQHPELVPKVELFMSFYFSMTGLHAIHMVIGAGLLLWFIRRAWRGDFGPEYYSPV